MRIKHTIVWGLFFLMSCGTHSWGQEGAYIKRRMELDIRPENDLLDGCLAPVLRAAGWDWSKEILQGYYGLGFIASMSEDGSYLRHRENYLNVPPVLDMINLILQDSVEIYHLALDYWSVEDGQRSVSLAELSHARSKAWDEVRRALDEGFPAIVWQPVSDEMANENPNPSKIHLPSLWSLIVGYDELADTYVIDS